MKRILLFSILLSVLILVGCPNPSEAVATSDTTAPRIDRFTIPETTINAEIPVIIESYDNRGVSQYYIDFITADQSPLTVPALSDSEWSTSQPESITLPGTGNYIVYLWIRDEAGNISGMAAASVRFVTAATPDTTIPVLSTFTGPANTTSNTITVTIAASDNIGIGGYFISAVESGTTASAPGPSDPLWQPSQPSQATLPYVGDFDLYLWVKDLSGNMSASQNFSVSYDDGFGADAISPWVTDFAVKPTNAGGNAIEIEYFAAMDNNGVTSYMVTASSVAPVPTDPRWSLTAPSDFPVSRPGEYTLYAWVKDSAGNINSPVQSSGKYIDQYETVFIYYGAGDNEKEQYLYSDLNEIESVDLDSADSMAIALFDRGAPASGDFTGDGDWTDTRAFEMGYDDTGFNLNLHSSTSRIAVPDLGLTESNTVELEMDDPNVLSDFISFTRSNYPSRNYVLIMSSWRYQDADSLSFYQEVSRDDTSGASARLYVGDVSDAIQGQGVDMIVFDACQIAMAEALYELKDSVQYVVASEANVPDYGLPYTQILNSYVSTSSSNLENLGRTIIDQYIHTYENGGHVENVNVVNVDVTMTLFDTDKISTLADSLDSLGQYYLNSYTYHSPRLSALSMEYAPDNVDLGSYTQHALNHAGSAGQSVQSAVDNLVVYHGKSSMGFYAESTGVSLYFPSNLLFDYNSVYFRANTGFAMAAENWVSFLSGVNPDVENPDNYVLNAENLSHTCALQSSSDEDSFMVIPSNANQAFYMTMDNTVDMDLRIYAYNSSDELIFSDTDYYVGYTEGEDELFPLNIPNASYYIIENFIFSGFGSFPKIYNVYLIDQP